MEMKKCPKCGGEILANAKFCSHCGCDLGDTIQVIDPETFLGPDEYRMMTEKAQSQTVQSTGTKKEQVQDLQNPSESGNGQGLERETDIQRENNPSAGKSRSAQTRNTQSRSTQIRSMRKNKTNKGDTSGNQTKQVTNYKTKVKKKTKKKRKLSLPSFKGRKNKRHPRRKRERDGSGFFGFLFKLIVLVAVVAALFFGYMKYGDTIISHVKDFYNTRIKTESTTDTENRENTNSTDNSAGNEGTNNADTTDTNNTGAGNSAGTAEESNTNQDTPNQEGTGE